MIKIFKYLRPLEWVLALVSVAFVVAQVWLELRIPEYTSEITILLQSGGDNVSEIWKNGIYMITCALGGFACSVVVGYLASRVASSFSRRLRGLLFSKVGSFSMQEINKFSTASLITRSTNDVTQVQMLVTLVLQLLVKAPITAVWAILKISNKGMEWTIATGASVGVLLFVVTVAIIFVLPVYKRMQKLTDNVNKVTRENLTGLRVVRAYNAEGFQQEKFEGANKQLTRANLITSNAMAIVWPIMMLSFTSLTLIIYWIGAYLIKNAPAGEKLVLWGSMNAFSQYAMQVIMSFMMLIMLFFTLPRALVSAKRIHEILDTQPMITDGTLTEGAEGMTGEVEFKNVSFKYPDANECVIEGISFVAKRGEVVAFIGSTGSGKSTIINLVPRFFDVTEGEVLVDGVNIKDYTLEALHNKIGYVPQKAVMFKGTVASNVAYGENGRSNANGEGVACNDTTKDNGNIANNAKSNINTDEAGASANGVAGSDISKDSGVCANINSYSDEEIKRAVAIAQGTDFVEKMDGGYNAAIAQGGTNVSGGQKQRLAIARAVCRDPEIYIFDDSFSALDYKTDRVLRSILKKETKDATSLIVAQRIGTIMDADKIIVLDEGKMVGMGKHTQLLQSCEVYRQIATSQLSEEELAL